MNSSKYEHKLDKMRLFLKPDLLRVLFLVFLSTVIFHSTAEDDLLEYVENGTLDQDTTGTNAYDKMMDVLTHKRCINCHPSGDQPLQGDDSHKHNFGIVRGPDNHGPQAMSCNACHQSENNIYSGVPGAPEWHLAPPSMAWEGLSRNEIARSMLDRSKNGNRSLQEIVEHLTEHELVLWAWTPGVDANGDQREMPPVSKEEYIAAVKQWAAQGAPIPNN